MLHHSVQGVIQAKTPVPSPFKGRARLRCQIKFFTDSKKFLTKIIRSPRSGNIFRWFFYMFLVLVWSFVFWGQIGILVTTIWDISDLLSWIFGDFKIPEIFMKFPDFEGKTTAKTHSNHHKINVFDVSRLRKLFPTILGVFPGSLTAKKHSWNRKFRVLRSDWPRKWARPLKGKPALN